LCLERSCLGKSTTIKSAYSCGILERALTCPPDFQLAYAYQAWLDERASWRTVIYLNLIRSVNHILEILTLEMSNQDSSSHQPTPAHSHVRFRHSDEWETDISEDETFVVRPPFAFTGKHKLLKLSLAPLRGVQKDLEVRIGAGASELQDLSTWYDYTDAAPFAEVERLIARTSNPRRPNEFFIRSNCGWKETLNKLRSGLSTSPDHLQPHKKGKQDSVVEILVGCSANIKSLWTDEVVQSVLKRRNMRLEESSGLSVTVVSVRHS
jgi:guanine nucleotide-binding protein alpha-1 subunit